MVLAPDCQHGSVRRKQDIVARLSIYYYAFKDSKTNECGLAFEWFILSSIMGSLLSCFYELPNSWPNQSWNQWLLNKPNGVFPNGSLWHPVLTGWSSVSGSREPRVPEHRSPAPDHLSSDRSGVSVRIPHRQRRIQDQRDPGSHRSLHPGTDPYKYRSTRYRSTSYRSIRPNLAWLAAAVAVAQSVKCPELRSLKEVQLNWREFDSRSRHSS